MVRPYVNIYINFYFNGALSTLCIYTEAIEKL